MCQTGLRPFSPLLPYQSDSDLDIADWLLDQSDRELKLRFNRSGRVDILKPLFPIVFGLMRMRPSDRISISEALDLLKPLIESQDQSVYGWTPFGCLGSYYQTLM